MAEYNNATIMYAIYLRSFIMIIMITEGERGERTLTGVLFAPILN